MGELMQMRLGQAPNFDHQARRVPGVDSAAVGPPLKPEPQLLHCRLESNSSASALGFLAAGELIDQRLNTIPALKGEACRAEWSEDT